MSGYPPEFRESIKIIEETREERLKITPPRVSPKEKEKLLRRYHPDYKEGSKRPIKLGASKGEYAPHEVANLLEAHSYLYVHALSNGIEIDLEDPDFDVDVLIIGGGGGGATAALWAIYNGTPPDRILLATKLRFGDANTKMAQGGIQAADREYDSPLIHFLDVMRGGHYTNDPELVRILVTNAPFIIKWLEDLGVMFDKEEDGTMIEVSGGGTSRLRMHSAGDYTGLEIMRTLMDEVLNKEVKVLEFSPAVELITDEEGKVAGAVLMNLETERYIVVRAKSTVLTTGGFGRLHIQGFQTTNHYGATMDGVVLAYRVGAQIRDLDSVQYHPTGAAWPLQIAGQLVTEKVRSLGAQLVNIEGEAFVYPLEPRDVVAAAIIRECEDRKKGVITHVGTCGVWLDSPMIEIIRGEGTIEKYLPAMLRQFLRFGIDIRKEPILVYPTLHYQNGGIKINGNAQVLGVGDRPIGNLFAAGEVTGGVHGKNRLMGNSLLEITVFGRIAGINASKNAKHNNVGKLSLKHVYEWEEKLKQAGIKTNIVAPMILPDYIGDVKYR